MENSTRGLRRFTWFSVVAGGVLVAGFALLDVLSGRYGPWWRDALLVAAVVVVIGQHIRYVRRAMKGIGRDKPHTAEHLVTFAIALAAWVDTANSGRPEAIVWAMLPAAVITHVMATQPAPARWVHCAAGVAVTLAAGALWGPPDFGSAVVLPAVTIVLATFGIVVQLWIWDLVRRLEEANATARALAIAEERLRFAADLHDIQGHHLQAIALKGELAERLVGRDDESARRNAREVADLARTALRETREVVRGYRRASLGTEITNAVGVLRAAGIETDVRGDASAVPPPLQSLFGTLVREGTTNVLRHSAASRCDVVIAVADGQVSVRLRNDGARPPTGAPGSGLEGLRERFATVGGRVEVDSSDEAFELVGRAGVPW
ncbi:histidine kinase [Actinosynnema sp. NPDC020468]|uniref:sensor histidine kinase n=1 Tax=Actinosynnema sp. NPDC020468 TaxID=3154488 RepID=UPI0033F482F4